MSGLNISCGEYLADDKSGSAFERVLFDLPDIPEEMKSRILSGFEDNEYTIIEPDDAGCMVHSLRTYRDQLTSEIGHGDWLRETEREEQSGADSINLKWGEGRGWRLYCATNLLAACEQSTKTHEQVVICLG